MKTLKKHLLTLLCLSIFTANFTACASNNGSTNDSEKPSQSISDSDKSNKSAKEILTKIQSQTGCENMTTGAYFGDQNFDNNCEKLYSIKLSEISDGGIIYSETGGYADEISIISLKSGDTESAITALEARKETRTKDFTGYKPDELDKIEKAEIFKINGYAVLIISENAGDLAEVVKEMV